MTSVHAFLVFSFEKVYSHFTYFNWISQGTVHRSYFSAITILLSFPSSLSCSLHSRACQPLRSQGMVLLPRHTSYSSRKQQSFLAYKKKRDKIAS